MPILYGDQLAARLDPKFHRETETLVINGFWLENERLGKEADFAEALVRGLTRLAKFVNARDVDGAVVKPPALRKHIQARMQEFRSRR